MDQTFYRDSSNKVLTGLISGLAQRLDLSSNILFFLRIVTLFLFFTQPITFLMYLVISAALPSKDYASERHDLDNILEEE